MVKVNAPSCTDRTGKHRLIWMRRLNGYTCQWCTWNFDPRTNEWTEGSLTDTQLMLETSQ